MTPRKAPRANDLSRRGVLAAAAALTAAPAFAAQKDELASADALGLAALVRARKIGAQELLDIAIRRAEALNPTFNFMAQKHYDYGRAAIARGLPDGPFTGVPWLLKDLNTYLAGTQTGQGSRFYKDNRATFTSEIVRRYERAGLVVFGKTTAPELGLSATTESLATGPTRNPWNPGFTAGGSSGGAAAAVAAGVLPAAHATDGGGSIRIPASCCGLFGLKPSRGRVPMGPARTEGWGGMSVHHAVTNSVRDSAALLDATHGVEPGSRYSAPTPERPYLQEVGRNPGALQIALQIPSLSGMAPDSECAEAVRAVARLCESLGHHVEEAMPQLDYEAVSRASFTLISASVAADLQARAVATGIKADVSVLEPMTLYSLENGLKTTGVDVISANNELQKAAVIVAQFMDRYDVILSPTLGSPPLPIGAIGPNAAAEQFIADVSRFTAYSPLQNQTGQPSMSMPLAMSKSGLPIGVMFSGRYGDEATLFRLAGQLEQAAPWAGRRATVQV